MWKIIKNKGFTLIELLISITILSIVLISFFTFFINTFRVNSMNSDDIQAMNVARKYKELIKRDNDSDITKKIEIWSRNPNEEFVMGPEGIDPDYDVMISIPSAEETNVAFPIHLVHIAVRKEDKLLSETFTYYEPVFKEISSQ